MSTHLSPIESIREKFIKENIYDFIQSEPKHKAGKYWNKVAWILLITYFIFCLCLIYATWMSDQHKTQAEVLRQVQIANGIPQRSFTINWK
jgi:cell division septal protein FtsQ